MPAMSPTMTSGTISRWAKQEGETFEAGEVLLEIETDKASIEVEAQDAGVMGKVLVSGCFWRQRQEAFGRRCEG